MLTSPHKRKLKLIVSCGGKNENAYQISKMKTARAKRAKLLFFIVKYANLSGS